jgi:hypothetical protein
VSRNYKFHNPEGLYFIGFAVVGWLYVFTRLNVVTQQSVVTYLKQFFY